MFFFILHKFLKYFAWRISTLNIPIFLYFKVKLTKSQKRKKISLFFFWGHLFKVCIFLVLCNFLFSDNSLFTGEKSYLTCHQEEQAKKRKIIFSAWSVPFFFSCSYAKKHRTEWGQKLVAEDHWVYIVKEAFKKVLSELVKLLPSLVKVFNFLIIFQGCILGLFTSFLSWHISIPQRK